MRDSPTIVVDDRLGVPSREEELMLLRRCLESATFDCCGCCSSFAEDCSGLLLAVRVGSPAAPAKDGAERPLGVCLWINCCHAFTSFLSLFARDLLLSGSLRRSWLIFLPRPLIWGTTGERERRERGEETESEREREEREGEREKSQNH